MKFCNREHQSEGVVWDSNRWRLASNPMRRRIPKTRVHCLSSHPAIPRQNGHRGDWGDSRLGNLRRRIVAPRHSNRRRCCFPRHNRRSCRLRCFAWGVSGISSSWPGVHIRVLLPHGDSETYPGADRRQTIPATVPRAATGGFHR